MLHKKSLNSILNQKRRLQMELRVYLSLREEQKENVSEDMQKRTITSFIKMSTAFIDPPAAEECFKKLHQMKDKRIFNTLLELLDECTPLASMLSIRDSFLKRIGARHPYYDFFRVLSSKCSYSLFGGEYVHCILEDLKSGKYSGTKNVQSAIDLLHIMLNIFPWLLRGSDQCLLELFFEKAILSDEQFLQILATGVRHIPIKLSDTLMEFLEKKCLNGTRAEAKMAVTSIFSLIHDNNDPIFSSLWKKAFNSLHDGRRIPTVLQSLGCIAQYSPSIYDLYEKEIMHYVGEKLFCSNEAHYSPERNSLNEDSICSLSCKLRIFGLKAVLKSFLPHQVVQVKRQIKEFLSILSDIIHGNGIMNDIILSQNDEVHLRLAAAKSILQLATRWDLYILPDIFHVAIMRARDPSYTVRKSFLQKINKLLKVQALPNRYACAFALASADIIGDIRTEAMRYLNEFLTECTKQFRIHKETSVQDSDGGTKTNNPGYFIVYLIHVLAHDQGFPSDDCQDQDAYSRFFSPLIVILRVLVKLDFEKFNPENSYGITSFLLCIFRAIQKAEDAIDSKFTPKLYILSKIGTLTVKALTCHAKVSLHASYPILLPSAYFTFCQDSQNREASFSIKNLINECFIGKILDSLEPSSCQHFNPDSKQNREFQVDARDVVVMRNISNILPLERKCDPLYNKPKRATDNLHPTENGSSRTLMNKVCSLWKHTNSQSTTASNLAILLSQRTNLNPSNNDYNMEKEQFSSCDSVSPRPIPDSQVCSREAEPKSNMPSVANEGFFCNSMMPIQCETSKGSPACHLYSKELTDSKEALVGHRIRIWSPIHVCYNSGTVDSYDSQSRNYKVTYDNGDVEILHLEDERWETIDKTTLVDKGTCNFQPKKGLDSSSSILEDVIHVIGDDSDDTRLVTSNGAENSRKSTTATVNGFDFAGSIKDNIKRKGPSVAAESCLSNRVDEITNNARMVRRRKN